MRNRSEAITGLLPRMAQLSALLSRGQLFEHAATAAGVTLDRPAMTILVILDTAEQPLRVGEIAARMQVVGPHVTRHLNTLEKQEIVKRVPDPNDQRARLIALTPSGQQLVDRYTSVIDGWFTAALTEWPDRDRTEFVRLLGRMVEDLTAQLNTVTDSRTTDSTR
ncbi:MarR family winged helix-turn-helix transcriptional regulator [Streptomyces sp. NRRL S-1022]|uniref:MarR family winged helix-turn-helix transcriptional regulator n=1 Tax=Streptomyces sp. NRRL S-1022 TaxID=1463880 RepID=UPI0004BF5D8C|nr:MarR family transcriptional regulator [Streptomyces sp. NRRL S-1022]